MTQEYKDTAKALANQIQWQRGLDNDVSEHLLHTFITQTVEHIEELESKIEHLEKQLEKSKSMQISPIALF